MLPSKSCKTINANFLLKNFGLTFFDRFKTGTYLVNWFGRGSADRTWRFGGSAEPCWTYKFGRYQCRFIGRSLCGGSILNRYQILSAAHCFEHGRGNPSDWIILVGKNNIRRKEIHQSKITRHKAKKLKNVYVAKKIIVHERWRVIFPTGSYFLSFRKANFLHILKSGIISYNFYIFEWYLT